MSLVAETELFEKKRSAPAVWAAAAGNILEWYDFGAYGFFAAIFGRNFFPSDNHLVSLLSAFGVFAAALFMRPLGGLIFGHIGDRHGRCPALMTSTLIMALSTFLIGCLPTYAVAGLMAPVLLIVLRLLQGISLGGEYSASIAYIAEGSDPRRRGFVSSLAPFGVSLGTLGGSCMGMLVSHLMPAAAVASWGWRIPFLLGLVLGGAILWFRRAQVVEPLPTAAPAFPLGEAIRTDWRGLVRGFLLSAGLLAYFYVVFVYFVTFAQEVDGLSLQSVFAISTTCLVASALLVPSFGYLSDKIGRQRIILFGVFGLLLFTWPFFRLLSSHHVELKVLAGELGFAFFLAAFGACLPAALAESFGSRARCSAIAASYNLGAAFGGGTAPLIAAALVDPHVRHPMAPALYLLAWGILAAGATLTLGRREGTPLSFQGEDGGVTARDVS